MRVKVLQNTDIPYGRLEEEKPTKVYPYFVCWLGREEGYLCNNSEEVGKIVKIYLETDTKLSVEIKKGQFTAT